MSLRPGRLARPLIFAALVLLLALPRGTLIAKENLNCSAYAATSGRAERSKRHASVRLYRRALEQRSVGAFQMV